MGPHVSDTVCSNLSVLALILIWMHRRFLNRLLGMPVERQTLLFNYFACTLAAEIQSAKAEGRYFEGVSDLGGSSIARKTDKPQVTCSAVAKMLLDSMALKAEMPSSHLK